MFLLVLSMTGAFLNKPKTTLIIQSIYLGGLTSVCLCFIEILVVAIGLLVADGVISVIIGFGVGWLSGEFSFVAAGLLFSLPILLKSSIKGIVASTILRKIVNKLSDKCDF